MKILFVSNHIYPCVTGGAEIFNYYLADKLSANNNVTLFSCCTKKHANIKLVNVKKQRPISYIMPLKLLWYVLRTRKKIDVIFLSYMRSHWFGWLIYPILKKIFGIEYIITIHGGSLNPWKPFFPFYWAFRNAFRLIGVSERICEEYNRRAKLNVKYIPPLLPFRKSENETDVIKEEYNIPKDSRIILYVGSLKELKSPLTLLRGFNLLKSDFVDKNNLYLIFAGEGNLKEEMIRSVKYSERTKFLGNVPREDIPDLYKISDLYVITSKYEATPLSLLEAMYNKLPVIGSDVKGINTIIENGYNGILFEQGNHLELSSKIKELIDNRRKSESYAAEALKTYERKYSYKEMLDDYQTIFNEAANEK
ncbi:MAG: glycosyltransferase family 4 protein [Candidatus Krumholzibacteriota bacterium]|nr:glycosyltransferase family 4 protein [Candidatus Krumholzibacteriota bacterium]